MNDYISDDLNPLAPTPNEITHDTVYSDISANEKAHMELTGRLPYFSSRGNEYVLIEEHYNANTIVGVPQKKCQTAIISKEWQ